MCGPQSFGLGISAGDLEDLFSNSGPKSAARKQCCLPAVCKRNAQPSGYARRPHKTQGFQTETLLAESIDHITKSLPGHHLHEGIGNEVSHAHIRV